MRYATCSDDDAVDRIFGHGECAADLGHLNARARQRLHASCRLLCRAERTGVQRNTRGVNL